MYYLNVIMILVMEYESNYESNKIVKDRSAEELKVSVELLVKGKIDIRTFKEILIKNNINVNDPNVILQLNLRLKKY